MSVFGLSRSFCIENVPVLAFCVGLSICWFGEVSDWTGCPVRIMIFLIMLISTSTSYYSSVINYFHLILKKEAYKFKLNLVCSIAVRQETNYD